MNNFDYFTSFIFGLLSSFHCVGMCGGIISFLSIYSSNNKHNFILYNFLYNISRIFSYGLIGVFFYSFGFFLFDYSNIYFIKISKIISACLIILIGFYLINFNYFLFFLDNFFNKFFNFFNFFSKKILKIKSPLKDFLLGIIWGNLPCGLVYSVLILSIVSGSLIKSFLLMIFFGLGTLPAVFFTGVFYKNLKNNFLKNNYIIKFFGYLIILNGFYLLIKSFFIKNCHLFLC